MEKLIKTPTPIEVVKKINELVDNAGQNNLKRSTAYVVGDIAYSPLLPSWARLECVQAGTTSSVEPQWTNILGGG